MKTSLRSHGRSFLSRERTLPPVRCTSSHPVHQEKKTRDSSVLDNYRALVLDGAFRPLTVINWHRAVTLDLFRSVEVLEYYDYFVQTVQEAYPIPAVLRADYIRKSKGKHRLPPVSRRNILRRDNNTCVYCGVRDDLTVDHVVPISRGGKHSWDNVVTACQTCNSRKGNRTLEQMGWRLRKKPHLPRSHDYHLTMEFPRRQPEEWKDYVGHLKI